MSIIPGRPKAKVRMRARRQAGTATVEMAIVTPLLVVLLFGTIELGLLLRDYLVLGTASREAARVAGLGKSTTDITTRARDAAVSLNADNVTCTMTYRSPGAASWVALTNTAEGANAAPAGSEVKVVLSYPHAFVSPLGQWFSTGGANTRILFATTVAMRE